MAEITDKLKKQFYKKHLESLKIECQKEVQLTLDMLYQGLTPDILEIRKRNHYEAQCMLWLVNIGLSKLLKY